MADTILYRITRLTYDGKVKWVRYNTTKHNFGAAKGDLNSYDGTKGGRVILEEMTIPEENIQLADLYVKEPSK